MLTTLESHRHDQKKAMAGCLSRVRWLSHQAGRESFRGRTDSRGPFQVMRLGICARAAPARPRISWVRGGQLTWKALCWHKSPREKFCDGYPGGIYVRCGSKFPRDLCDKVNVACGSELRCCHSPAQVIWSLRQPEVN